MKRPRRRFLLDGRKLQAARRACGWTVRQLERQMDGRVSRISIYRIEHAGVTGVHEATMFLFAMALNVHPMALAPDPDPEPESNAGQTPRAETETES